MLPAFLSDLEFWKHVSIPFVAAIVGWGTNWVAIKLTFLPLEPIGKPPFLGWQGIIPSKAEKMATTFAESTMHRLGTLPELFEMMEPEKISSHITAMVDLEIGRYTEEIVFWSGRAGIWKRVPELVKEQIYARVRLEMPKLVDNLVTDLSGRVEEVLDFKHMLVTRLVEDKVLLNRLFLEAGVEEFKFIIRSGFYFGFLFGLIQLAVWIFYPAAWVLPVFGLIVGYATNWIAINAIFRPLHPTKVGPWTLHGLFLRRQKQVAAVWCRLVTREILTIRRLVRSMLAGPKAATASALIEKHIQPVADEVLGIFRPVAEIALGAEAYDEIKEKVGKKAVQVSADPFDHWDFNEERAEVIEAFLRERMESLPSEEFQDLLRPCFQEDEMKLILVGAALGFLAGLAQLFLVFGAVG